MSAWEPVRGEANWEKLERQDWHLWILAVLLLFVLGISLLSFMFPSVFWLSRQTEMEIPEKAFFGFCILLALTLVYMLQRQATVRQLKRSLFQAQVAASEAEHQVHLVSLTSLPELHQFRDSLAMEFRRASHAGETLSVVLLELEDESETKLGRMVHLLRLLLRPHETLFRLARQRFGLILPIMRSADAEAFAAQITERLGRSMPGEKVTSAVPAYPDQAGSLTEMEGRLRAMDASVSARSEAASAIL